MAFNLNELKRIAFFFLRYGISIAFIFIVIFVSFSTPHFLTFTYIVNIILQSSVLGAVAVGVTLVIISRGIDLSVIIISHRVEHIFAVGDRVMILKRGSLVGVRSIMETTMGEVIRLIVAGSSPSP